MKAGQKQNRNTSLNAKLIIGCLIMLSFSLALAIGLIGILWQDYRRASQNLQALTTYRQVLIAANLISAERGPMNGVLGEEPLADTPTRRRLAEFRTRSDASLDAITAASSSATAKLVPQEVLGGVRQKLANARKQADAVAARPRRERSSAMISDTVRGMFDVVEAMRPVVSTTMAELVKNDPSLAGQAMTGQMLGDLREYGGRIGSYFAMAIAAREPFSAVSRAELFETRGRILEIWQLAESQLALYADAPELQVVLRQANNLYFGTAFDFYQRLTAESARGEYTLTTEQMTNIYVPMLAPLEALRSRFLDIMLTRAQEVQSSSASWLRIVGIFTGLIILANLLLIIAARRLIFVPLLKARDHVVELSEERGLEAASPPARHGREIKELFHALDVLRLKLRERRQLTAQLKVQAETDGLTGLLNRRTFDRIGQNAPEFEDLPLEVGLILMDIDHFKAVNDTYGHTAGDMVLRGVARLVSEKVRKTDLVIRYGGEEIALVLPGVTPGAVSRIAEALRAALASHPIDIGEGRTIRVTASFGIALGHRDAMAWARTVEAADADLYAAKAGGRNRVGAKGGLAASATLG